MRKKNPTKEDIYKKINSIVADNYEYALIDSTSLKNDYDSFLIMKSKELTVMTTLEMNIFQPFEKVEDKTYLICFILSFSRKKLPPLFEKYAEMGCEVIRVDPTAEVSFLEDICNDV